MMRLLCLTGMFWLGFGLSQQATPEDKQASLPKGYRQVGSDKADVIDKLCKATAESGLFTGAVLVADGGKVIYRQGFGMANREWDIPNAPNTKFRLASVSKQFCSMLVMQLTQEEKVSLDDSITRYLPYYRKDTGVRITLHHLLSHQSGIPDFTSRFDYRGTISRSSYGKDEFIREYCSGDLLHEPGTIYSYCNAGYCILGRIIEKVTGKSYERVLRERIFKPLGMKNSGYDRNQTVLDHRASGYTYGAFSIENADYIEMDSTPGAAGAIYSTVEDMFLWDRALYTDQLLTRKYRDLMFTPNRDVPEVKAAGGRPQSTYGYGWQIFERKHPVTQRRTKIINHGGAINGFRAMESRLVNDDAFVIILCNLGDRPGGGDVWNSVVRLNTALIHIVTEQPFRMPAKPRDTLDQRLYQMVQSEGVAATIEWFQSKGKKAAWGGSLVLVAEKLISDGLAAEGLQLLEYDVEMTPTKVWLIRKTAQAFLDHGAAIKARRYAEQGLELRPDDDRLLSLREEAMRDLEFATEGHSD